jgi:hypothetical protein
MPGNVIGPLSFIGDGTPTYPQRATCSAKAAEAAPVRNFPLPVGTGGADEYHLKTGDPSAPDRHIGMDYNALGQKLGR